MEPRRKSSFPFFSIVLLLTVSALPAFGAAVLFEAAGANGAAIQSKVDAFRAALGSNNGVGNPVAGGRREINWDGVPVTALDPFPGGFFNSNSARGLVLSTVGTRMKVSGEPGSNSFLMKDVTAQEWGLIEFSTFSPEKLFAPIGSVITDGIFFVPGTQTRATVRGFGAVFVDVDVVNATRLEAWDAAGKLLFSRAVSLSGARSKGLSFLGVLFDAGEGIARVRLVSGTNPIESPFQDPPPDGVALDDFIYGEPQALSDALVQTAWIAAAIKGPGANGSDWRTDVSILNSSGFAASYRLDFMKAGVTKSVSGTLTAGQQRVLTDAVGQSGESGIGAIRLLSDQPLKVSAYVYNTIAPQATCLASGRFGFSTFGRTSAEMLNEGEAALLPHLQEDGSARSNIGFTNTGLSTATVNVTLFDDSGAVLTAYDVNLSPGEVRQENGVFVSRAGRSNVTFGSARVLVKFGNGIIAYGSVVENSTNDPRYVEMLELN